jgi:hypothetical protein
MDFLDSPPLSNPPNEMGKKISHLEIIIFSFHGLVTFVTFIGRQYHDEGFDK